MARTRSAPTRDVPVRHSGVVKAASASPEPDSATDDRTVPMARTRRAAEVDEVSRETILIHLYTEKTNRSNQQNVAYERRNECSVYSKE